MSNFYINSVKRKMKFQRLDLENLQNDEVSELNNLSPQDEIRQEESNLRDETISNLKLKLHNNFSHILGDDINDANDVIDKISDIPKERDINNKNYFNEAQLSLDQNIGNDIKDASDVINKLSDIPEETDINNKSYLNEAQSSLDQIQKLVGLETNQSNSNDLDETSPDKLMDFISELRILTEKRSQIKSNLQQVDESLLKLQEKIFKHKKVFEDKIAHLESINEIYNQSAKLVSKIVSEDTKYEQL